VGAPNYIISFEDIKQHFNMPKRSAEDAGIGREGERATSENMAKLRKQIEYYFGDFNLPCDRFMNKVIKENKDGWFPAETLLKFKKVKDAEVGLCEIVEACMDSDVVKVNDAQTHIKRKHPLKGSSWITDRTIQAKGFPKENCSLNDMIEFWAKVSQAVRKVQFCGRNSGVLNVSFETKEIADDYAANKHVIMFKGAKILCGRNLYKPPSMKRVRRNRQALVAGDRNGYHAKKGKRQRITDHVANKDLIGVEVGVEKASDIVGEERDDWEKKAEAERAALGL